MKALTLVQVKEAFALLDARLPRRVTLVVGGGGAMLLAYNFPLATMDVDALPKGMSIDELKPFIEAIAKELAMPSDWLNPWFGSFTHVLRPDFDKHVVPVFSGEKLTVVALSKEDLLLMKCFAHRAKDIPHARVLLRSGADTAVVEGRIEELKKNKIPGAGEAMDFLDEMLDLEDG